MLKILEKLQGQEKSEGKGIIKIQSKESSGSDNKKAKKGVFQNAWLPKIYFNSSWSPWELLYNENLTWKVFNIPKFIFIKEVNCRLLMKGKLGVWQ